ncbi:Dot/Icm T4SS effector CoxCC14 [Coxiella burnetii]|uniref:Uncharacterized protein n=1 Tax=Coxiella burnetii (strain RSA 493 / Nine Mile phase I) TaxID=227377 RepID=Q83B77_COXBU|nr:Dot/Icm T4SS effector CoxCC14 [Coxiella burnetii]NP_820618.1 hypothetical protein CBU_1636 [Coxiella burnetii RSA 493]AAO91132.1 hypothetical protein CBU_1636 [Coxiella burnetii RSA 493]ARI66393.1 hypothetical protein B7L74_08400 [Coxiella burnetii]ARK27846.1 hypothetical protein BMW92_08180 [Coxiella burnetii]ATN74997.1 hypothetical protein AYM90_08475 [Coxiella burnetii]ATN76901.1 hypothetical protein AYM94_08480 [Coxiella burnetii]
MTWKLNEIIGDKNRTIHNGVTRFVYPGFAVEDNGYLISEFNRFSRLVNLQILTEMEADRPIEAVIPVYSFKEVPPRERFPLRKGVQEDRRKRMFQALLDAFMSVLKPGQERLTVCFDPIGEELIASLLTKEIFQEARKSNFDYAKNKWQEQLDNQYEIKIPAVLSTLNWALNEVFRNHRSSSSSSSQNLLFTIDFIENDFEKILNDHPDFESLNDEQKSTFKREWLAIGKAFEQFFFKEENMRGLLEVQSLSEKKGIHLRLRTSEKRSDELTSVINGILPESPNLIVTQSSSISSSSSTPQGRQPLGEEKVSEKKKSTPSRWNMDQIPDLPPGKYTVSLGSRDVFSDNYHPSEQPKRPKLNADRSLTRNPRGQCAAFFPHRQGVTTSGLVL